MAELTEEEKIVIGVCSAVAGLVLIGIIIFVCCVLYRRRRYGDRRRPRGRHYKERIVEDHYGGRDNRYYGNDDIVEVKKYPLPSYEHPPPLPPPMALAPPPPPEPLSRWDMYGEQRERREPVYISAHKTYGREVQREVNYDNPPIVIPMAEPEYLPPTRIAEPDTIYLKYRDDQALLYTAQPDYSRAETRLVRRARSMTELDRIDRPRNSKYVGEWGHTIQQPFDMKYNDRAAKTGRDPFLWG